MTLGEIFGGLTLFLYQYISLLRKKESKFLRFKLIYMNREKKVGDHFLKRLLIKY